MILLEAAKGKQYKCPYCDVRLDRVALVTHIEKKHKDFLPKGFSSARTVFNLVNKKEDGHCVIDGKITEWNEVTWRYNRFCCGKCRNQASLNAEKNLMKIYGKTKSELLSDGEHQKKMLANRGISGTYKFTSGGSNSYTGSYERKLLEFLDTVLQYTYLDVLSPGPCIEYEFEGKTHIWIIDQFIAPFNLAIDCKDGGDNPNNRGMESYRAKQVAKEAAIKAQGKYNYIRLTDNNFAQLLYIMAEIKEQFMNISDDNKPIIRINEETKLEFDSSFINEYSAAGGPVIGTGNASTFIVQTLKKNTFSDNMVYGVSIDAAFSTVYLSDEDGVMKKMSWEALKENYDILSAFKFTPPDNHISNPNGRNLAEIFTGRLFLTDDQLFYDSDFERIVTLDDMVKLASESFEATLRGQAYKIPIVNESTMSPHSDVMYYEDQTGVFVENTVTRLRSKSYAKLDDITQPIKKYIERGML